LSFLDEKNGIGLSLLFFEKNESISVFKLIELSLAPGANFG